MDIMNLKTPFEKLKYLYDNGSIDKDKVYEYVLSMDIGADEFFELIGEVCEVPLSLLKEKKITELDKRYNEEILAGFYSDIKGEENRLYGFITDDQLNLESLKNNVALGLIPEGTLEYYAKGQPCEFWSNTEFMMLYQAAMVHKIAKIRECKLKKQMVKDAETIEMIEEVMA